MRRPLTIALAAGLAALVAVALVDALRGSDAPQRVATSEPTSTEATPASPADWLPQGPGLAALLAGRGVTGTLYLSADGCLSGTVEPLRGIRLPSLELVEGPAIGSCTFSVSTDGRHAAGEDAVWSPVGPTLAAETGTAVVAIDAETGAEWELPGRAPAFRPDGALALVDDGAIVTWSNDCADATETVSPAFELVRGETGPYCRDVAVARDELDEDLPQARLRRVVAQAWTSNDRVAAVLDTSAGPRLATFEHGRAAAATPFRTMLGPLGAQPGGAYVSLLNRLGVTVYDEQPLPLFSSSLETFAYDWSPGGDWLAYAREEFVYLVRVSDWSTHFRLPLSTQSLAWRP